MVDYKNLKKKFPVKKSSLPKSRKVAAIKEGLLANGCNIVGDYNTCKSGKILECIVSNRCYTATDSNVCKTGTIIKRPLTNGCNIVRDYNTCK